MEVSRMLHEIAKPTIAMVRGFQAEINFLPVMVKRLFVGGATLRPQSFAAKAKMIEELGQDILPAIAAGTITPVIDSVFEFADVENAHARMESGEHTGKVLLAVDSSIA